MSGPEGVRTAAIRALAAVLDGRSLKSVLGPAEAAIADPRDRALLHTIVLAGSRGALRWRAALKLLMERPLPARARPVEAALIAGLAQLAELDMPAHAVLDQTVAAVRALGHARHAGLVNAVLRRWLREREAIEAAIADDPEATHLLPRWLLDNLQAQWPQDWPAIVAAGNASAPMWLRINPLRTTPDDYAARLAEAGIEAVAQPPLAQALRLVAPVPVARLPGFADGLASVQDGAAQYAAQLLDLAPGQRVLDACAAPGGKTAHLLEREPKLAQVVALDRDPARLVAVRENLARLGLAATLVAGDAGAPDAWWDGRPFDRILLDAPCSATGILRRQPDVRLHRREADIAVLAAGQLRLLTALWPLLAPGGRLLYAVCSILRSESETVLEQFLAGHDDATALPLAVPGGRVLGACIQLLPGHDDLDGFAYGLLAKA
jgi:16S rRNA (cytosine967-C5)-methyltransferase